MAAYSLFGLALIAVAFSRDCTGDAPDLYWLCVLNLLIFILHTAISYLWLQRIFPEEVHPVPRGASSEVIEANTRVMNFAEHFRGLAGLSDAEEGEQCAICMGDYEQDDSIRVLRCRHYYHQECIDEWLGQKDVCPLCLRPIQIPEEERVDTASDEHSQLDKHAPSDGPLSGSDSNRTAASTKQKKKGGGKRKATSTASTQRIEVQTGATMITEVAAVHADRADVMDQMDQDDHKTGLIFRGRQRQKYRQA